MILIQFIIVKKHNVTECFEYLNRKIKDQIILGLPISDSMREFLDSSLRNNFESIAFAIKDFSIVILKSITTLSSQFMEVLGSYESTLGSPHAKAVSL